MKNNLARTLISFWPIIKYILILQYINLNMNYEQFIKRLKVLSFGPDLLYGQHVFVLVKSLQPKMDSKVLQGIWKLGDDKLKVMEYLEKSVKPLWK